MTSTTFFFIFIPILSFILLLVNLLLAPHNPYQEKERSFECGFSSFLGQNRTQFSVSFFIFGLLFLLFDLEILLVYPYSVSGYNNDIYGLIVMMVFFVLLTLGFIFELGKNALTIDSKQTLSLKDLTMPIIKIYNILTQSTFINRGCNISAPLLSGFNGERGLIVIIFTILVSQGWLVLSYNYPSMNDITWLGIFSLAISTIFLGIITTVNYKLLIENAENCKYVLLLTKKFVWIIVRNLPLQLQVTLIVNLLCLLFNLVCVVLGFLPPVSDIINFILFLFGNSDTSLEPLEVYSGENIHNHTYIDNEQVTLLSNPNNFNPGGNGTDGAQGTDPDHLRRIGECTHDGWQPKHPTGIEVKSNQVPNCDFNPDLRGGLHPATRSFDEHYYTCPSCGAVCCKDCRL